MSHAATHWLAKLPAANLSASEFRVLFHLCDCHNPAQGCFPTQAYLMDAAGVSNGTLNNALKSLEAKGLISRQRRYDEVAKKALPTRYILGFEVSEDHTPNSGDRAKPDSNLDHDHTPISGRTILQQAGDITCKEPGKEPVKNDPQPKKIPFSETWSPSDRVKAKAAKLGFSPSDIHHESAKCSAHYRAKGDRFADLDAVFEAWLIREKKWRPERKPATGHEGLLRRAMEGPQNV